MSNQWNELPEDWRLSSIKDHLIDYRGGAPLAPADFTTEGIAVLPKKGVNEHGSLRIPDDERTFTSPLFAIKYRRSNIFGTHNLVTTLRDLVPTGPSIGLIVSVPSGQFVLSQGVYAFELKDTLVAKFLVYLSQTPQHRRQMRAIMVGSTQVHIRTDEFFNTAIPLPSAKEQRKIARILTTVDNLIEKTEALIAKYQAIKQGMMHDLFTRGVDEHGHLRPPYEDAPELYKQSELGWIPKEWEVRPVTDVTQGGPKNGYFKKPELVGRGYKLVNVTDLYQPYGIDTDNPAVERVEGSSADFKKYCVMEGDLFITRSSLVLTGLHTAILSGGLRNPLCSSAMSCGFDQTENLSIQTFWHCSCRRRLHALTLWLVRNKWL